ncbi:carboxypeptidase-like regulatory domain-containing protein, partial [Longispora fulva]|uniref:carboxypeptidase-like regulatory domain-containing protein n=2 Tax=Bacteria TaxID=2 RepID=UPI0036320DEA
MISERRALFFSAFILLFFFSYNVVAQRPEPPEFMVSGKVTDEAGTPLEYATISFQSTRNPDKLTGGITDAQGTYAIEVPRGVYNITIEFIGFGPKSFPNRQINADLNLGTT